MKCTLKSSCKKPKLETINNEIFCYTCHSLYPKGVKVYQDKNVKEYKNFKLLSNDRLKYLRKNFSYLHNNIILFLNEAIERIKDINNLKRISNDRYLNSLYKFYCQQSNIKYKPLVDKNIIKLDDNIINMLYEIYNKYTLSNIEDPYDTIYL